MGGDFNTRTGKEGEGIDERQGIERREKSKDMKMNDHGKKLVKFVEENGWSIFNGCIRADDEGKFTYTGKGCTVIDYVMEDLETSRKKV